VPDEATATNRPFPYVTLFHKLFTAEVLCIQLMPGKIDGVGIELTATEAEPLPEAFTARIFIGYVLQLVKPLLMIIGLSVTAGEGVTQVAPLSVEYS
jgi:hypothetical protein